MRVSRRRFLATGAAAALAAGVGAACGGGADGDGDGTATTVTTAPVLTGDVAVASLIAGLENLAIDAYDALIATASAGELGDVPAVIGAIVASARAHHIEHLAVWNRVLRVVGRPEVEAADAGLQPTLDGMLAEVSDVGGAARLALLVEEILADTYLKAVPTLVDRESVRAAALILATDQQHQTVLRYALGENPVPEPIQIPDKAAS
jgi:hypothetical protein